MGEEKVPSRNDKEYPRSSQAWWSRPATVTLLTAIVAAVAPATIGIYTSITASGRLQLEQRKQVYEMRQEYLNRVLDEKQSKRVLEFLIFVEEDYRLRDWAKVELRKTEGRADSDLAGDE